MRTLPNTGIKAGRPGRQAAFIDGLLLKTTSTRQSFSFSLRIATRSICISVCMTRWYYIP